MPASGARILGFGRDPATAAGIQNKARAAGFRATTFALTDDADGDARLVRELRADDYDVVTFGGAINGQNTSSPPDEHSTIWFERVLNIVHREAPTARIALVRTADEYVSVVERVLGPGR
jgi:hypothetical protein